MSRQTKFDLKFASGITCKISLKKSFSATTGFLQGSKGRQVRTIKVLTTDDATPSTMDDIEELVPWGELETYHSYRDDSGETKLLPIDKKALQALFKNSNSMLVQGVIDTCKIKPYMFDDAHYFVNVQHDSKTKDLPQSDRKVYTVIYHYLLDNDKYMLVKFISSNREKYGLLYADPMSEGLRLSLIIHSTYQRAREAVNLIDIPSAASYGEKLVKGMSMEEIAPEEIIDDYEVKVMAYIERLREGGAAAASRYIKIIPSVKTTEIDILDQIGAL